MVIRTSEDLALMVALSAIRCVLPDIPWGRRPQHRMHDILFFHKCLFHPIPNICSTVILSTTSRSRRTAPCVLASLLPCILSCMQACLPAVSSLRSEFLTLSSSLLLLYPAWAQDASTFCLSAHENTKTYSHVY